MRLPVTLYPGEDGFIVAECPVIPGCISQGRTEEEALANIKEAIGLCLEVRKEAGLPLTLPLHEIEVAI
ncbi:type II toxin-antitoxin system HicB family antitoxin [Desulfofundulus thermocisternus]|uniref:type II toxin-antitoxin system HicB family antitoxin n=1 Tax=Desulfofundulus thermocisternus TaxID=42471 RepID=UPI00217D4A35|nr:type II toxin-antitoxin system HicB family antitoxin [Desulfofundulus thermocisternus]MCS5697151.1 type II toxin-antitoxin system HicB family antitoxin [Desulfofundulus thermocisternus]